MSRTDISTNIQIIEESIISIQKELRQNQVETKRLMDLLIQNSKVAAEYMQETKSSLDNMETKQAQNSNLKLELSPQIINTLKFIKDSVTEIKDQNEKIDKLVRNKVLKNSNAGWWVTFILMLIAFLYLYFYESTEKNIALQKYGYIEQLYPKLTKYIDTQYEKDSTQVIRNYLSFFELKNKNPKNRWYNC